MHIHNMVQRIKNIFTSKLSLIGLGGLLTVAGSLVSCNDYTETASPFLNGESKTPIAVRTNISANPISRAYDKTFEKNDQLYAYIEAGKKVDGEFVYENQFVWHNVFTLSRNVTTTTDEGVGNITSTTATDDLSPAIPIYWDDFSSVDYDLRSETVDRGIRVKYGYCYNGGAPVADSFNETAGILTWTVQTNQTTTAAMKNSDLLYAATQPMVKYTHDNGTRGELTLPYTHAMSKITVNVKTGEGYATDKANFGSSVLTLKDMQIKANVNAPAATVTAVATDGTGDINTFVKSKENTAATYQAIVGPTSLSAGNVLAHITNIDGNNYDIPLTTSILEAWSDEERLTISEEEIYNGVAQAKGSRAGGTIPGGKGYITKPGIHYILDVTVDKQKIIIRATITDWDSVKADGKAVINFAGDVTEKGTIADELKANGFDVYKSNSNTAFSQKSTTVTYADNQWKYSPEIYWAGQSDNSYFRAVSPKGASASTLAQGTDLMWGTSAAEGKSGNADEAAIAPRTGDVSLDFEHLMSKLCVKLETTDDAAAKVNLAGATIKITNLATTGSYSIVDGTVSAAAPAETMLSGKPSGFTEYVIPQNISDAARLIITLADGTTYSLQLNECVDSNSTEEPKTPVEVWNKGKFYKYTIRLEKEKIFFRALVKEWEDATGNGHATLEWD